MITCRKCNKEFARPQRRGRPPVECDSCKGGAVATKVAKPVKRASLVAQPAKPSEARRASAATPTPTKADSPASEAVRAAKKVPYRSGFCGITAMGDGTHQTHPQHIHKLCRGGACSCGCHQGENLWGAA